jgi:hypothetical protein
LYHQIIAIYLKGNKKIKKQGQDSKPHKKQKMKNLKLKNGMVKLSAVLGFIFLSSAAVALGGDENIIETQRTIRQHISFPNIILPISKTEKVEVVFTTDEKGKVNFVLAKTENEDLKKQIEKQFSEMTLTKIKSNVAYSIVFNIKKV